MKLSRACLEELSQLSSYTLVVCLLCLLLIVKAHRGASTRGWPASKLMLRRSVGRFCDLYAALGVRPSATHGELRDAYLRLAKQHHPDVSHLHQNASHVL